LSGANFHGANLSQSVFDNVNLAGTDFSETIITGATLPSNFSTEQLHSTASYQNKNLTNVNFSNLNMTGWNFTGQNLTGANLRLPDTSYRVDGADFRGAVGVVFQSAV